MFLLFRQNISSWMQKEMKYYKRKDCAKIPALMISVAKIGLGLYVMVLIVKALRKYTKSELAKDDIHGMKGK